MKTTNRILILFAFVALFIVGSASQSSAHMMGSIGHGILFSPDDGAGGGGDGSGGGDEPITMTEEEWKKKFGIGIHRGGMKEAEQKFSKKEKERLEKLKTAGVSSEDFDQALDELLVALSKKGADKGEEVKIFEDKIAGLNGKLAEKDKEVLAAREEKNTYIINSELSAAAAKHNAMDVSDAITVFRSIYRVDRLSDGSIHIYDKSGEVVKNKDFNPATLEEVMGQMLEKKDYLVKTDFRGGSGGKRMEGAPAQGFLKRDSSTWTQAEKEEALKLHKEGKISLKSIAG